MFPEDVQNTLRTLLLTSLRYKERIVRKNPIRSVLLHGSSGIGKTTFIRRLCSESGINIVSLGIAELCVLSSTIANVFSSQPCILLLDHIELLFGEDEFDKKPWFELTEAIDQLPVGALVLVVGISSRHALVPSFVSEWFNQTIEVSSFHTVDQVAGMVLSAIPELSRGTSSTVEELVSGLTISSSMHIAYDSIVKGESFVDAVRSARFELCRSGGLSTSVVESRVPKTRWEDIIGLSVIKQTLQHIVEWRTHRLSSSFLPIGGALLYGPPGTGKTMLARAMANQAMMNFVSVSISDVLRGEVGASERILRETFDRARASSPCIVFFDELQAMFHVDDTSSSLLSQLNIEWSACTDDKDTDIFILGATNVPQILDSSMLLPGRFDYLLYVPPPDCEDRLSMLRAALPPETLGGDIAALELKYLQWAESTEHFTGADIKNWVRQAEALAGWSSGDAVDEPVCLSVDIVDAALQSIRPSITREMLQEFEEFAARSHRASHPREERKQPL